MSDNDVPYTLTVDGLDDDYFIVQRFKGREAISETYQFDIVVIGPAGAVDEVERTALGQTATFTWTIGAAPRAFYGVISAVRVLGPRPPSGAVQYELRFVPRLWLLKRKRDTRIFQNMRVPDVVTAVLLEAGISTRWQLTKVYPVREYITQYEESYLAFVKRILAEAGILFYFPQGGPISDAEGTFASIATAAGSAASSAVSSLAGSAVGSVVSDVVSAATPLIPGDTLIGTDDAGFYPGIGADDAAALEAATAAAMAPEVGAAIGSAVGGLGAIGDAVVGEASAVAGDVIEAALSSAAPTLYYLFGFGGAASLADKVTSFTTRTTARANQGTFRDYDPDRPMTKLESVGLSNAPFPDDALQAIAGVAAEAGGVLGEVAPGPVGDIGSAVAENAGSVVSGIESLAGDNPPPLLPVYEHHADHLFPKWTVLPSDEGPKLLRQRRRRVWISKGESGSADVGAAHKFTLSDHPLSYIDQPYVVTSVVHKGNASPTDADRGAFRVYENAFECAPATVTYAPARPKRRAALVSLTATVVGPKGAEIYVSPSGQIKVQFHWDRTGSNDEKSSCWIRTMHPWGGASFGVQFIPRVGMEVLVVFDGGDPDKPIVIGSVYNGTHPTPFPLPQDMTRSGFRTQSSPGGGGYNELSFEDAAGAEQVLLHAQRDHFETVGITQAVSVGVTQTIKVGQDRSVEVERNQLHTIHGDKTEETYGVHKTTVHRNSDTSILENATLEVGGSLVQSAKSRGQLSIGDDYYMKIAGDLYIALGDDANPKKGMFGANAHQAITLSSDDQIRLIGRTKVQIECGDSVLTLDPDGIHLKAKSIALEGGAVSVVGDGPALHLTDDAELVAGNSIKLTTKTSSLSLDANASLKGGIIKLNCGDAFKPGGPAAPSTEETKPFKTTVTDSTFTPYAGKHYLLVVGEKRLTGTTGGDGSVEQTIPKAATGADLTIWVDEYPTGARQHWAITLTDDLPPATDVAGLEIRLTNLGYTPGQSTDMATLSTATVAAIAEFQSDHQLPATGKVDADTLGKLVERHGN